MSTPHRRRPLAGLVSTLQRGHEWAHRGPVRSLVAKLLVGLLGSVLLLAGAAMLVLPGPGMVVIVLGLGVLAAEWEWARHLLVLARVKVEQAKAAALPSGASLVRRAGVAAGALALGAVSWVASIAVMGGPPAAVTEAWTTVVTRLG